jgi:dienelactone hydrolase
MGAVAALRYAASGDNELAGVVSISAPATFRTPRSAPGALVIGLARTRVGRQIAKHHLHVRIAPTWKVPPFPSELVGDIVVPIAIVHGDQDRYIPTSDAQAIYQACNSPHRRLELVPGMGHAFDYKALPAVNNALNWLLAEHHSTPQGNTLSLNPLNDEGQRGADRRHEPPQQWNDCHAAHRTGTGRRAPSGGVRSALRHEYRDVDGAST